MEFWSSPLFLWLILPALSHVFTVPQANAQGQSMTINRRTMPQRTPEEWGEWAKKHKESLEAKYGDTTPRKRSSGTNLLTNQNGDSSYFGSLAIGTPPKSYNVILDTGSADLWVADSECVTGCGSVATFNPSESSTFQNQSTPFYIAYGSGKASGNLGQDIVQMAGFSVTNQIFAICDYVSSGLLTTPVSGLLGLGFQTIASSKAMPFWETLVSGGAWDSPVMAFYLTRYLNATNVGELEPGGSFDMGFTNSSLYSGDIDYVSLPTVGSYWILPMNSITIQGMEISLPSGQESYSAIDTGTTLVGGPSQYIAQIFAQIPGSAPGRGDFANYYTYPCDTDVNIELNFGGSRSWSITSADFLLSRLSRNQCLGAFFELQTGKSAPSWIVGDTFLKNVYSVFRYDPPAVGFAQLSDIAIIQNESEGSAPTPSFGSTAAAVSATDTTSGITSDAVRFDLRSMLFSLPLSWAITTVALIAL